MNGLDSIAYFMEDVREASRLEEKVDPSAWVNKYLAPYVRGGAELLSVGCGPGVILQAAAALHPGVTGTGVDISADRIQDAIRRKGENQQLAFVQGDAQSLQFSSNTFDLVYCRMLLEYLPRKEAAVAEMVRVCKPGGRVLLQDLDGQLLWHYPVDPVMQRGVEAVVAALSAGGFDPYVGRKLFWFAQNAGLSNLDVQAESYHLVAGAVSHRILKQWELKLDIAKPQMAKALGGEAQADEQIQRFLAYLCRPDTLTYSTVFTVTGEKAF